MNTNEIVPLVVLLCVFCVFFFGQMILRRIRPDPLTISKDTLANTNVKPPNPRLEQIQKYGRLLSAVFLTATVFGTLGTLLLIFSLVRNGTILNMPQHQLLGDVGVIVFVLTLTLEAW